MLSAIRLSAKRLTRAPGLDSLFPYYAGFSQEFVAAILEPTLRRAAAPLVLDPWNGSGTTTAVATRHGYKSVGVDLNPFAAHLARAKQVTLRQLKYARRRTSALADEMPSQLAAKPGDPLRDWLPPEVAGAARYVIDRLARRRTSNTDSLLVLALARACRRLARAKRRANPTWARPTTLVHSTPTQLLTAWIESVEASIAAVEANPAPPGSTSLSSISSGDARALRIATDTVDLVITSPPYCTRIDYAVQCRLELALLDIGSRERRFASLRRNMMGTTSLRPVRDNQTLSELPKGVSHLLGQVRTHASHRAAEYYYPWLAQYWTDARRSLAEVCRVLKPKAPAYLVLQNSYFKDVEIDLATLYLELAASLGMLGNIVAREPVATTRNKASANLGARRYADQYGRRYFESVLEVIAP